ncbi:MAG: AtpZ/AtpI family protein [Patescibacteria group bacterium]
MEQDSGKQPWWEPAVEIFSKISVWIAAPVIFALVAGKWLDTQFGTKPWIFLGLAAFGFLISIVGMIKTIQKFSNTIEKETPKKSDDSANNKA